MADHHYETERFSAFLARAELAESFGEDRLNTHPAFMSPPYLLDRSRIASNKPLVVFFEHRNCHACDVLHAGPLSNPEISAQLKDMDVVQVDMHSNALILTPGGHKLTAREWVNELGLFYAPTIMFFDERGKEIIRINSVVWVYRLNNVLRYISSGGYKRYATYQLWRQYLMRKKMGIE
ncbi:MAG: thioredoxin fold domain-containing protein [Gammaproteobacteria bacterium]|nr:thioredoxin fold domain-containing protein [Gammaproteobacteria bacterium]